MPASGLHAEVHHAVAAAHDQASTPSATHCSARSRASSGVAADQAAHREAGLPQPRQRQGGGAGAPALAGGGVGQEGDLAGHAASLRGGQAPGPERPTRRGGCSGRQSRRATTKFAGRTPTALASRPSTSSTRSAVNAGARYGEREPAVVPQQQHLPVLPGLVAAAPLVVERPAPGRRVDAEQVAGSSPSAARRARPGSAGSRVRPDRAVQLTSTVPSQSGRSNGSTLHDGRHGPVSPRPRTGRSGGRRRGPRRGDAWSSSKPSRDPAAPAVDHPRDHLGDHEQQRHRDRQQEHRERVGRRRRDRGEHEGADARSTGGSGPAPGPGPRRRG